MVNRDAFSGYHPLVNFLYFALVLVFGMCFMHPVCLVISLGSATAYNLYLKGRKGLLFSLRFLLPMMLLAAILNPAFNHEGVTILGYENDSSGGVVHQVYITTDSHCGNSSVVAGLFR